MKKIGKEAFLTAAKLEWVYIPRSVEEIGEYAFGYFTYEYIRGNYDTVIYGHNGTAAQKYAEENDFIFKNCSLGDMDFDSNINSLDASAILSHYAAISTNEESEFNRIHLEYADVDGDGVVNALDASYVLTYYAHTATGGTGTFEEFMSEKA